MKITHPEVAHADERGSIIDILAGIEVNYATVISSKKGVVRGNHYHQKTIQWVYVLRGQLQALSRRPDENVQEAILNSGDLLENQPHEEHTLVALEDSEFLVLTSGLRGGKDYEKDTYRVEKPLQEQL
jgi:dTDP-4-dehydrorhamnose 3,5-epimerase-like enzyme